MNGQKMIHASCGMRCILLCLIHFHFHQGVVVAFAPVALVNYNNRMLLFTTPATTPPYPNQAKPTILPQLSQSATQLNALPVPDTDLLQHALESTSRYLADAATAASVDAGDKSWWDNYLEIFKGSLSLVHSTIDQPLRSIGIDQTWGVAIAVFTMLIRTALLPLSIGQSKSAEYMKILKPYTKEIRERFKDNKDAQNRALAKLYEDAQQNPLAGCLTSLAQLPILLGLYRGISLLAKEGELEQPFLWIPSLEGPVGPPDYRGLDWLISGWMTDPSNGLPSPSLGWEMTVAFLIMPVILVFLQGVTMSTLQPPMDDNMSDEERETMERTQLVFKFLPLLIGFFSIQVPAGLTIYWFTSSLFTLAQSLGAKAYFAANPPKVELPEYWDTALNKDKDYANMTPEERRKAVEAGIRVGPTMDELVDEARFHAYVERSPLRLKSMAWESVSLNSDDTILQSYVPSQLKDWVAAGGTGQHKSRIKMDSSPERMMSAIGAESKDTQDKMNMIANVNLPFLAKD